MFGRHRIILTGIWHERKTLTINFTLNCMLNGSTDNPTTTSLICKYIRVLVHDASITMHGYSCYNKGWTAVILLCFVFTKAILIKENYSLQFNTVGDIGENKCQNYT